MTTEWNPKLIGNIALYYGSRDGEYYYMVTCFEFLS